MSNNSLVPYREPSRSGDFNYYDDDYNPTIDWSPVGNAIVKVGSVVSHGASMLGKKVRSGTSSVLESIEDCVDRAAESALSVIRRHSSSDSGSSNNYEYDDDESKRRIMLSVDDIFDKYQDALEAVGVSQEAFDQIRQGSYENLQDPRVQAVFETMADGIRRREEGTHRRSSSGSGSSSGSAARETLKILLAMFVGSTSGPALLDNAQDLVAAGANISSALTRWIRSQTERLGSSAVSAASAAIPTRTILSLT
jgi:hypothetical protein